MRTRQINFRCTDEQAELFEAAARDAGVSLTQWFILLGLHAAGHDTVLCDQLERVQRLIRKKAAPRR